MFQGAPLVVVELTVVVVVAGAAVAGTVVEPTVELTPDTWASCAGSNNFNIPNNVSIMPTKTLFAEHTITSTCCSTLPLNPTSTPPPPSHMPKIGDRPTGLNRGLDAPSTSTPCRNVGTTAKPNAAKSTFSKNSATAIRLIKQ